MDSAKMSEEFKAVTNAGWETEERKEEGGGILIKKHAARSRRL